MEWWPGGIHSPIVYFHLRHRQLSHQAKHVAQDSKLWRNPCITGSLNTVGARRGIRLSLINLPNTCTNVSERDSNVVLTGVKTLHVSRGQVPLQHIQVGVERKLSESKRRCTERGHGGRSPARTRSKSFPAEQRNYDGHARCAPLPVLQGRNVQTNTSLLKSPFASQKVQFEPPIFPGRVVQRLSTQDVKRSNSANELASPQSAPNADYKTTKFSPDSVGDSSQSEEDVCVLPILTSSVAMQHDHDPTMDQYHKKQYEMKREHAFHCHQVIELSDLPSSIPKPDGGVWSAMLRMTGLGSR